MEHDEGLLLERLPYGESSLIVTWLTPRYGILKTMAQGAHREKSPMRGRLDLFYHCEIGFTLGTGELARLREVRPLAPHLGLRREWVTVLCARYFAELCLAVVPPMAEAAGAHELLRLAWGYLDTRSPSLRLIERFELRLLESCGLGDGSRGSLERALQLYHRDVPESRKELLAVLRKSGA